MEQDIRIISHIAVISEEDSGRKELNIVSVNSGPYEYDIREWSPDRLSHGEGIRLTNQEAKVLLAVLKDCLRDDPDQISIDTVPVPPKHPISPDQEILDLLTAEELSFTDNRSKGGGLWVTGGHELDPIMGKLADSGYRFTYSEKGGKATKHQSGWYLANN